MPQHTSKNVKKNHSPETMFHEWFLTNSLFDTSDDPSRRLHSFLKEIQRRILSEQIIIYAWTEKKNTLSIWELIPDDAIPMPAGDVIAQVFRFCAKKEKAYFHKDFISNTPLYAQIRQQECSSMMCKKLYTHGDTSFFLIVVNYSTVLENRIFDFLEFLFPVLSVLIQNIILYNELKARNEKVKDWTKKVEERIRQGTKTLLEKETRYHALFENATDGIVVIDDRGSVLEINKAACSMTGFSKKDLKKKNWLELVHNKEKMTRYVAKALDGVQIGPAQAILFNQEGKKFDAEIVLKQIWYRGRKVVQCFVRDVSLRRILEQGLKNAKEKYETLVENSLVGVFILEDGKIKYLNQIFEKMTGYFREELIGKRYSELIKHDDKNVFENRVKTDLSGSQFEIRFETKDGYERIGEIRLNSVIIDGKSAIIGNIIDITDQRALEAELFENQKMKSISTLAGGIAHDFNNLLGGILGYASLILSEITPDHEYFHDIQAIADTTKKAAELTNHLLAFARGGRYRVEIIEVKRLVENIVGMLTHTPDNFVTFNISSSMDTLLIKGDLQQIRQVFINICMNSVEASEREGKVAIKLDTQEFAEDSSFNGFRLKAGSYIKIQIRDFGKGMDEVTKNRMFEPFYSTKTTGTGKGLGLALVYGVIKNHGGALQVESSPNMGTSFIFYMPAAVEQKQEKAIGPKVTPSAERCIFIVDDEKVIRDVSRKILEREGYSVITASGGKEALDIYEKRHADISVVVLDLVMPDLNGEEVYKKMCTIESKVKVLFASGYAPEDREEMKNFSYNRFIQKPFKPEDLTAEVSKLYDSSHIF